MQLHIIAVLVTFACSQARVDPSVLQSIFNTTLPSYSNTITIKLKEGITTFVDGEGRNYVCIPQYPYDPNIKGDEINDTGVTGCGVIQERIGDKNDEKCEQLVDSVCTIAMEPVTPEPSLTEFKGCGYRNLKGLESHNTETQFGEFPWVVALLDSTKERYVGVGALISPEVVVTTAHVVCRRDRKTWSSIKYPNWLKIRAGEWDLTNSQEVYGSQERNVKEVYILNEYNRTNPRHNIALLLLEKPLELTDSINTICLPEQDEVFDRYKNCIANGWEKDVFDPQSQNAKILKKVEIDIVPYTRCSILLRRTRLGYSFKLHSSFICAGGNESENTCQGDGGAPLVCPIGENRYKLTGLVSWGIGCGQKDIPALYTNVPKYRHWVDKRMQDWDLLTSWYRIEDND